MSKLDRHLTTEELSALLDNQLTQEEDQDYRGHLESCQQCQQELADLKQTVRLLHALPQPPLPRSFVLTAGISQITPSNIGVQNESNIHILRSNNGSLQHTRTSPGQRVLSLVGALAAVVGILFVLSGFVPFASPTASNSAAVASPAPNPSKQENTAGSANSAADPSVSAGAGAQSSTPAAEQQPHSLQPNQAANPTQTQNDTGLQPAEKQATEEPPASSPASSLLDWETAGTRIGLGILLFIAGLMGIAVGRGRRRART